MAEREQLLTLATEVICSGQRDLFGDHTVSPRGGMGIGPTHLDQLLNGSPP
jgi:hypothetical protein